MNKVLSNAFFSEIQITIGVYNRNSSLKDIGSVIVVLVFEIGFWQIQLTFKTNVKFLIK
jgi:hypothetical protein